MKPTDANLLAVGRLVVPHATERTLSQGKYMSLSYEGKIIAFSDTVITIDVFRKDNIDVRFIEDSRHGINSM